MRCEFIGGPIDGLDFVIPPAGVDAVVRHFATYGGAEADGYEYQWDGRDFRFVGFKPCGGK